MKTRTHLPIMLRYQFIKHFDQTWSQKPNLWNWHGMFTYNNGRHKQIFIHLSTIINLHTVLVSMWIDILNCSRFFPFFQQQKGRSQYQQVQYSICKGKHLSFYFSFEHYVNCYSCCLLFGISTHCLLIQNKAVVLTCLDKTLRITITICIH